jgi:hypothetical protein
MDSHARFATVASSAVAETRETPSPALIMCTACMFIARTLLTRRILDQRMALAYPPFSGPVVFIRPL